MHIAHVQLVKYMGLVSFDYYLDLYVFEPTCMIENGRYSEV